VAKWQRTAETPQASAQANTPGEHPGARRRVTRAPTDTQARARKLPKLPQRTKGDPPVTTFDRDSAHRFIARHGSVLEQMRLAHWCNEVDDDALWDTLADFQNPDGGWAHGLDPDYAGPASSVHTTLAALRLLSAHNLLDHPKLADTFAFLEGCAQPDGTWQELFEVTQHNPPPWYQPAQLRIWETGCIAGYAMTLGYKRLWTRAAAYVRQAWAEAPSPTSLHPCIAALLLLGPSARDEDRAIHASCRQHAQHLLAQGGADPYDAVWLSETLLMIHSDLSNDPMLVGLTQYVAAHQAPDGGLVTAYGDHLRAEATLCACIVFDSLYQP
jgi:hypothetical protein